MKRVPISEAKVFELPFGYIDAEGVVHKTFGLRPLTGKIRKKVSMLCKGKSLLEHLHTALQLLLTHIGDIEDPPRSVVSDLVAADRDHILFVARLMDESEETQVRACSNCGSQCSLIVDLSKDTEFRLPEPDEFTLVKVKDYWYWSYLHVDKRAGVESAQLRLLTAADEEDASKSSKKNVDVNDVNHGLISRAVLDLNGEGVKTVDQIEDLEAKTIDSLKEKIEEQGFGPDSEFTVDCQNCNSEEHFVADTVSRFLGVGRQKAKQS